jgi:hypothetical protein
VICKITGFLPPCLMAELAQSARPEDSGQETVVLT